MRFGNTMPLRYLFTATFANGKVLEQTPEDLSVLDPEKRNTYYDLLQLQKESPLVRFELREQNDPAVARLPHTYAVDLTDGHFEVNGVPFVMHQIEDREVDPMSVQQTVELGPLQLVYFINNKRSLLVGGPNSGMQTHSRLWRFGWRCNVDGKNYQEIMQVV